MDLIKKGKQDGNGRVEAEEEDDVDDFADEVPEGFNPDQKIALRPKVDQATRWNSVAAMLARLV